MEYIDDTWYIALAFSLVFFIGGRLLAELAAPRKTRIRAGAMLGAFAVPSLLIPLAAVAGALTQLPWYITFRSVARIETVATLVAPFAGFATQAGGGQARSRLGEFDEEPVTIDRRPWPLRLLKPLALPLTLAYVSASFVGPLVRPLERAVLFFDKNGADWSDGVMLASGDASSGPAALATALSALGALADGNNSERDICIAVHASAAGADIWQLARYAASIGCQWRYMKAEGTENAPPGTDGSSPGALGGLFGIQAPTVARVADASSGGAGGARRYIALLEADGNRVVVGDPAVGRLALSRSSFESRYRIMGPALALRLPP